MGGWQEIEQKKYKEKKMKEVEEEEKFCSNSGGLRMVMSAQVVLLEEPGSTQYAAKGAA